MSRFTQTGPPPKLLIAINAVWMCTLCSVCSADPNSFCLVNSNASIRVTGTSTLHNWEISAETIHGVLQISEDHYEVDPLQDLPPPTLNIRIPATSLKSGKTSMDKVTWSALRSSLHPEIEFTLQSLQYIATTGKEPPVGAPVLYEGDLLVAGVIRPVEMNGTIEKTNSRQLKLTGSGSFNMTDFDIEPPAVLLGLIRAGDRVTVHFSLLFEIQP